MYVELPQQHHPELRTVVFTSGTDPVTIDVHEFQFSVTGFADEEELSAFRNAVFIVALDGHWHPANVIDGRVRYWDNACEQTAPSFVS